MIKRTLFVVLLSTLCAAFVSAQGTSMASSGSDKSSDNKSSKGPVFRPTKDQIKQVQTMLKDKKLYTGDATGSYNDDTRSGIKSFQKDNGLKQTGTLNRATLEKFGVALTDAQKAIPVSQSSSASSSDSSKSKSSGPSSSSSGSDKPKKPAPFRASSDQIKAAQKMLKDGKMYTGEETGKLDDATRDGLSKYQQANGLKVTGTLNADTLTKMGIALSDAQKANAAASSGAAPKN